MPSDPRPLDPGYRFNDRFELRKVLGRGGFGIAYLCTDLSRGDSVVVKELAPIGTPRLPSGLLVFDGSEAVRLREQFLEEAALLSRFDLAGVPPIRATFRENGTAYFATDYISNSKTLDELLRTSGTLSCDDAIDKLNRLLVVLEAVHAKRILHRDIKPSNILVRSDGEVFLIDFGAAREWHADSTTTHTVLYTPGFAPPEQMSERARRGPATDLFALAATFFALLTGSAPASSAERASGMSLPHLGELRPDLDPLVAWAFTQTLSLSYSERPQTVAEFRDLLESDPEVPEHDSLDYLDETLVRLKRFSFDRRGCPVCNAVMSEPRPLRRGLCPVCRNGNVRRRDIQERLCPSCKSGVLSLVKNFSPIALCPSCGVGILQYRRKSILSTDLAANCQSCESRFETKGNQMAKMDADQDFQPFDFWRNKLGRSAQIWVCGDCTAQYDVLSDGRWQQIRPSPKGHKTLYPEEWARVAAGLEPGSGNAYCDSCAADYYLEGEHLTLLGAPEDPYGFSEAFIGRLINLESARWLGAGKTSPNPGLLCEHCTTEFDRDQQYLRLSATTNRRLVKHVGEPKVMEDWHRLAKGLPTIHAEQDFADRVEIVLRQAYHTGKISFDDSGETLWKGNAVKDGDGKVISLSINHSEITYGGIFMKKRQPTDAVVGVWADETDIHLQFSGQRDTISFGLNPVVLVAHLSSGDQTITVSAKDLAIRISNDLGL